MDLKAILVNSFKSVSVRPHLNKTEHNIRKELTGLIFFAALVPAEDGVCWRQGDPHRGRQGLHRPEHCRNERGDRPATRELPAETSGRENQQVGSPSKYDIPMA